MNEKELADSNMAYFLMMSKVRKPKRATPKERCIELLRGLGITSPNVSSNKGYWAHRQQDCYKWEFNGTLNGVIICGGCWESMTACAKASRLEFSADRSEVFSVTDPSL